MNENLFQNTICISNKDRINGSLSKFEVEIIPTTNITKIIVEKVVIPFSFYPINQHNNIFVFNDGLDRVVTLQQGVYTSSTLIAEVQTKMNATPSTYTFTVTQDAISKKITIAGSSTFTLKFDVSNSVGKVLGYGTVDYPTATSHLAAAIIDLSVNNRYIDVYSDELSKYNKNVITSDHKNPLMRVSNSLFSFGNNIEDEKIKNTVYHYEKTATLRKIDIGLYDSSDNLIEFNGVDNFLLYLKIFSLK